MNALGFARRGDVRIDEEHHRHFERFARLQRRFGKAETLHLVEIGARFHGRDVEDRRARGRNR